MYHLALSLAAAAVLALPPLALAEEAADSFYLLYGNDLKRVAATKDTADDLALARQLLEEAKTPKTEAPRIALLCDKANELALKDPKGVPVAIEAMKLAAGKIAGKKGEYLEKIVAVRQQQYAAARGDAKAKAAEDLVLALECAAEAKDADVDLSGAEALLRRALAVARTDEAKERIKARLAAVARRQKMQKEIEDLKTKVGAHPDDAASRGRLIHLLLVEFDNPAEAAKFVHESLDDATRKYVPAAVRPLEDAPELACLELGDWYMTLSDKASDAARRKMLLRAVAYYSRFLELHPAQDADRKKAVLARNKALAGISDPTAEDVLKRVDPAKDFLSGKWDKDGGLHVAATPGSHCAVIPVVPEGAYELRVKFTRNVGRGTAFIVLPVGPSSIALRLESNQAWLASLRSKEGGGRASTGTPELNWLYTLDITVRPDERDSTIDVRLDGKPYLSWHGSWADLGLYPEEKPISKSLGVGSCFADVTFNSVELRMISGKATPLPPVKPPTPTKTAPPKSGPTKH